MSGKGATKPFSAFATNLLLTLDANEKGQGFMRYNNKEQDNDLFKQIKDNISQNFANKLGLSTDDTFYYIYGILNSNKYKTKYKNDLRKDLARISVIRNVRLFVDIGKKLMDLHINYEDVTTYTYVDIEYHKDKPSYQVKEMKHPSSQRKHRDVIEFNNDITIKDIPLKAYDYVFDGKPAIEWILNQYRIKQDKKSGIVDNTNNFSDDPKYIFDLLLRIINVSMQTVDLVDSLPKMDIIND